MSNHLLTDLAWLDRVVVTSSARQPTVDECIRRLEFLYRHKGICDEFWHVFQAVMSPDFGRSSRQSMRQYTLGETNRALTEWVQDKVKLNILVADFVGASRLVGAIINLNMQKKVETTV